MNPGPVTGAPPHRLRLKTLTSYGAIQLGLNAVSTTCLVHLFFFYNNVLLLDPALAGLVIFLGHLWDGITDPIVGLLSDRTRAKSGRRRPYFIPGAIFMAIFYALLFMPPIGLSESGLFWYMLVTYIAFCTGRTMLDVPYNALTPEITTNYDERSRLAGWRTGMMIVGDMMGGLLPIVMLMTLQAQRPAFTAACGGMAAVAVVCGIVGWWGTYETFDPASDVARERPTLRDTLKRTAAAVSSVPAGLLILTFGLVVVGTGFPYTIFRYVSEYFFHNPDMDLYIMIAYQSGGLLAAPFWIWACHRFSKKFTYQGAILGYVTATLPVLFCGYDDRALFLAAMVGCGICGTGIWMVPNAIAPDVIEWHRLQRTRADEGAFYGLWSFTGKFASGVPPWIIGLNLKYVGFESGAVQTGEVLQTILALFVIYPLGFMGLGALVFTWYPISRDAYHDILRRLEERAQAAAP